MWYRSNCLSHLYLWQQSIRLHKYRIGLYVGNRFIADQVFLWHPSVQLVPQVWRSLSYLVTALADQHAASTKHNVSAETSPETRWCLSCTKEAGVTGKIRDGLSCLTYRVESHSRAWRRGWEGLSSWANSVSLSIRLARSWADASRFLMCWTVPLASPSSCIPFVLCVRGMHTVR